MLVDTSVWVDHLRRGNARLARLLDEDTVHTHPFVIGELACGNLRRRDPILDLLRALPGAPEITHEEALAFVDGHELAGVGVGWVDVHLLASAKLAGLALWTLDGVLAEAAERAGV